MPLRLRNLFKRRNQSPEREDKPADPANGNRVEPVQPLAPGRRVQPEEIRDLGELIRTRYGLDVEIWGLRDVGTYNRRIVVEKMVRSDAILQKIRRTIQAWDFRDAFESETDWMKFQAIKERIDKAGKREWAGNPPWED